MGSPLVMSWAWFLTLLGVAFAGYAILWWLGAMHGRRRFEDGYDAGYDAALHTAGMGVLEELPPEPPAYAGTVTTMGLPDDTFPGWPSSGRHARPGLVETMTGTGSRLLTTGDLSILPSLVQGDDFLRRLDAWERAARAECEGMLA